MNKFVSVLLIPLFAVIVLSYTPPEGDNVQIELNGSHTIEDGDNVLLVLESSPAANSCSNCGSGNCIIQCGDYCNYTTNLDIGGFNVTFNGTGQVRFVGANLTNYQTNTVINQCQQTFE